MNRHSSLRVAALVFSIFVAVTPVFASPRSDSGKNPFERIIFKLKKIFLPVAADDPSFPHP
jgi:hypothetical protein